MITIPAYFGDDARRATLQAADTAGLDVLGLLHEPTAAWQPACEAIGLATITYTAIVIDGKHKTKRTYRGPVPYDLRHSFASLLIHEGQHSLVQISEWLGHSTATLLAHYAHVIADVAGRSLLPSEHAIMAARATQPPPARSNSTPSSGRPVLTRWLSG